ncbi:MAG TPA: hypothetical protein VFM71_08750 [Gemmatimonadaceae bacterium]|nr:hypothetical protein [Gemmatimonadaceae bacterium]
MLCGANDKIRRAALVAALAGAATLGGCDLITGVEPAPCELVPLDSIVTVDAQGDTVASAVTYWEQCGGVPNY